MDCIDTPDLKTPRDCLTWGLLFLWLIGAMILAEWILSALIPDYRMYDPNSAQGARQILWAHVVWLVLYFLPFCLLAIIKAIVRARKREAIMLYEIEN